MERGKGKKKNVNFIIFWQLFFFLFFFDSQFDPVFFFLIWRNFSIFRRRNCDFILPSVKSTNLLLLFFGLNLAKLFIKKIICTALTSHLFT